MFSPLLQSIIEREDMAVVSEKTLDDFLAKHNEVVLFISGDYKRLVEVNDVAVILPEIIKASKGRLQACVADRESERAMQLRYQFNAFPALVFLRKGDYLGVITRVLDWDDYIMEIGKILSSEPKPVPAFQFPEGCATEANGLAKQSELMKELKI